LLDAVGRVLDDERSASRLEAIRGVGTSIICSNSSRGDYLTVPKPPVVKSRQVISALDRAGFERVDQEGSHVKIRHEDGRIAIVVDHGGRDYPLGTLRRELARLGITIDKFRLLLEG
jgi:predicted RNA binding protein YcfA (HicA-like mRNA interferase family)